MCNDKTMIIRIILYGEQQNINKTVKKKDYGRIVNMHQAVRAFMRFDKINISVMVQNGNNVTYLV